MRLVVAFLGLFLIAAVVEVLKIAVVLLFVAWSMNWTMKMYLRLR